MTNAIVKQFIQSFHATFDALICSYQDVLIAICYVTIKLENLKFYLLDKTITQCRSNYINILLKFYKLYLRSLKVK